MNNCDTADWRQYHPVLRRRLGHQRAGSFSGPRNAHQRLRRSFVGQRSRRPRRTADSLRCPGAGDGFITFDRDSRACTGSQAFLTTPVFLSQPAVVRNGRWFGHWYGAEPPLAAAKFAEGAAQIPGIKVGPHPLCEDQFSVGAFPEEKVTQPLFSARADQ